MKKLVFLSVLVAFFSTSSFSQEVKGDKERNLQLSAGLYYGQFNDEFIKKIYPSYSGFDLSYIARTKYEWLSLGAFLRQFSAKDGNPQGYGFDEEISSCDIKMFSWGPLLGVNLSENFMVFTKLGFLKIDESLNSDLGNIDGSVKGNTFDFGVKAFIPVSDSFKLFGITEYTIVELKEGSSNGKLNSWNIGGGVAIFF